MKAYKIITTEHRGRSVSVRAPKAFLQTLKPQSDGFKLKMSDSNTELKIS